MSISARTIRDFGEQWQRFPANEGYYASVDLLRDICGSLVSMDDLRGARVAEVGSGTGRIVRMLAEVGVESILAVEPSTAFVNLAGNVRDLGDRVILLQASGDRIPSRLQLDFVFAVGVLHHIPEPGPVVEAAFHALRPGGRLVVWVYGREGNGLYLALIEPIRRVTTKLPHHVLAGVAWLLSMALNGYRLLARLAPVPLRDYVRGPLARLTSQQRRLVIYDQLNPSYSRYYTAAEVVGLLEGGGFRQVGLHHRHGYSWTATGWRPIQEETDGGEEHE